MLGTIRYFVQYLVRRMLENVEKHGPEEEKKCTVLQIDIVALRIVNLQSPEYTFIALRSFCFESFIGLGCRAVVN